MLNENSSELNNGNQCLVGNNFVNLLWLKRERENNDQIIMQLYQFKSRMRGQRIIEMKMIICWSLSQHVDSTNLPFLYTCPVCCIAFSIFKPQFITINGIYIPTNTDKHVRKYIKPLLANTLHLPINKYRTDDENDHDGAQYHGENGISWKSCRTLVI